MLTADDEGSRVRMTRALRCGWRVRMGRVGGGPLRRHVIYSLYNLNMEKAKMEKIKQEAAKLGTSYYKFVEPFIININEKIGRGSYGQVFKGADIRNGSLVAVKTISTSNIKKDPQKFYESLKNQIEIMKAIKNRNIVELYDVKKSSNNIYLFQELCERGSLEEVLQRRKRMPEAEALIVIRQLISGYRYLHQHSVIHRDLKPANILIKDETYKIADFGFAKFFQEGAELEQIHQSLVGSPMYMCPEILNGSTYSTKSDVWSMGVIFYQLLFGKTPHKASSLQQLISKVNKKVIRFPQRLSTTGLQQLLENMLKYSPQERISWKEIFGLELFRERQREGNDINRSMSLAQKGSKDTLEMSTKMNAIYFEDKKVIQQMELTNNDEKQICVVHSRDANQSREQDIYKSIAQKYQETEGRKDVVRKIKNWFLFKRNKAVFLNHLSLKIHNCFAMEKLGVPLHKAEMFILVLSKWQCMITYKSYIRLKEGKINSKAFSQEQYKLFINNNIRDKIMEKFKNDFTVMKMFFDQLVKKVEAYLAKHQADLAKQQAELSESLKRIRKICNQSLCPKELFAQIYNQTIDELLNVCKQALKKDPQCRELVQLGYLACQAARLKKEELQTDQFSMIYDQEQKLTNEQLMGRIEGKLPED